MKKLVIHFFQKVPENIRPTIVTCVLALAAGLSAVAFMFMTNLLFEQTYMFFATQPAAVFMAASFIVIAVTSLLVGYLLNVFSPEAAGSGIPQVKTAYWKELGHMSFRPVLVKFIAGMLSIGGGNSLGREGPSVFLGSGVSSNLDGLLGAPQRQRRGATLIGAAAGLAAAFNTPLAAITFVIEEVVGDLNSRFLGRVVLASVIGAFTVYAILGRHPAFSLPPVENISWLHYLVVPAVSIVASGAGLLFHHGTIALRGRMKKQKGVPAWLLPLFGGLITWVIGCAVFLATGKIGVFGLGYQDLSAALSNDFAWQVAGLMMAAKLAATIAGYGFGGCGGIFAPSLFIGGMAGYFLAGLAGLWMPLTSADHIVLAAVGMSSCLGAIVGAPLTSMLIVFEMTHQFALVPGLMIGTIVSQAMSRRFGRLNFYDHILVQDGHELHRIRPPLDLQSWQRLPISAVASPNPVVLAGTGEEEMRTALDSYPFNAFPVSEGESLRGIVTRQEMLGALESGRPPVVHEMGACYADETVKEVGSRFVESAVHVLIVLDRKTGAVRGIITLHDLIRAQAAIQN